MLDDRDVVKVDDALAVLPCGRFAIHEPANPLGCCLEPGIHIVVNRGRIRLAGAVDTDADKTLAGLRARGISGALVVDNAFEVVK